MFRLETAPHRRIERRTQRVGISTGTQTVGYRRLVIPKVADTAVTEPDQDSDIC